MEFGDYARLLARRWALVASAVVLGLAGAAGATLLVAPTYSAGTQLFVSTQINAGNLSQELFQGGSFSANRVKSYIELATSPKVLNPVIAELGLQTTPEELGAQITATAPPDTVLIDIIATDRSPETAAALANVVSTTLSQVIETLETPGTSRSSPVNATVVSGAAVPLEPVSPNMPLNIAVGLLVGLAFGIGLAVVLERLDTSVKNERDLAGITGLPVLAAITRDATGTAAPILRDELHSSRGEAYRQLRTNLQFAAIDVRPGVVVVTSALPGEGKSSVAGNLAMSIAQMGTSVCLVDGDLRRPSVADYFGLVGDAGLTTLLIGRAELDDVLQPVTPNLMAITSGTIPPNPSELLASARTSAVLRELAERFDTVLVDAPPTLPVTDAALLAAAADGTLLVVHCGRTTRQQVESAVRNLQQVKSRLLGAVLNMTPPASRRAAYYGYGSTYEPLQPVAETPAPLPRTPDTVVDKSAENTHRLRPVSRDRHARQPGPRSRPSRSVPPMEQMAIRSAEDGTAVAAHLPTPSPPPRTHPPLVAGSARQSGRLER